MKKLTALFIILLIASSVFAADKIERKVITTEYISIDNLEKNLTNLKAQRQRIDGQIEILESQIKQAKEKGEITVEVDMTNSSTGF